MDQKTVLRVGIIGCGRIGSLWDEKSASAEAALTHAKAYIQNAATSLQMVSDISPARAETAARHWKTAQAGSVNELIEAKLDIVSLCTPVSERIGLIQLFSEKSPGTFLIIEKPLAETLNEAQQIAELCKTLQHEPLLNYSRRFTPGIQQLQDHIFNNTYGRLQSATGYYGNGFLNNGSHMIDLVSYLFGRPHEAGILGVIDDERIDQDATLSFFLKLASGARITVNGLDHRHYTVFELDLMFEKARVRLTDRAMTIQTSKVIDDPVYEGYRILEESKNESTRYELSLARAVQEAVDIVHGQRETPSCTPEQAVELTRLMENMLRSFKK